MVSVLPRSSISYLKGDPHKLTIYDSVPDLPPERESSDAVATGNNSSTTSTTNPAGNASTFQLQLSKHVRHGKYNRK